MSINLVYLDLLQPETDPTLRGRLQARCEEEGLTVCQDETMLKQGGPAYYHVFETEENPVSPWIVVAS